MNLKSVFWKLVYIAAVVGGVGIGYEAFNHQDTTLTVGIAILTILAAIDLFREFAKR